MLSVKHYPADYVDACAARFGRMLDALADAETVGVDTAHLRQAAVLAVEHSFVHRMRGNEGKDGNPLNELRMLAASILTNDAVLAAEKSIRYDPARSVTGIALGEPIEPSVAQLRSLADAVVGTIGARFG